MVGAAGSKFFEGHADQRSFLHDVLDRGLSFKLRSRVGTESPASNDQLRSLFMVDLPELGCTGEEILHLVDDALAQSLNFSSPDFLGFPDAGNSVAALAGAILEATTQQNLLNASFCARAATFVEVATVGWLRGLVGWPTPEHLDGVQQVGGVATYGGTLSNAYGLLMARHRASRGSFSRGLRGDPAPARIFVPSDLAHYSIRGAAGMLGFGTDNVVQVPTRGFRYDLDRLEEALVRCSADGAVPACVVVNAGDSRTLTVDDIAGVCSRVRASAPECWIHVDACHGHQLLFSETLRDRLNGIEQVDSVSLDPHKVLNIPYNLSYFLYRDPGAAVDFWLSSQLIMAEPWSIGQITPLIGSKTWASLKLYLHVMWLGRRGIADAVEARCRLASAFRHMVEAEPSLLCMTDWTDINSVPFVYVGPPHARIDPGRVGAVNEAIYGEMLRQGRRYLHGFNLRDDAGKFGPVGHAKPFVLRYMAGNPLAGADNLAGALRDVVAIGARLAP